MDKIEKKRKSIIYILLSALGVFIIAILVFFIGQEKTIAIAAILFLASIITLIVGQVKGNKLKKKFKQEFLKPEIETRYPDYKYQPHEGFSREYVNDLGIYKRPDRFHSEDLLFGVCNGVEFKSSDVRLEERHTRQTQNGTQTYYRPYFVGRIFEFDFNKNFSDSIVVTEGYKPVGYRDLGKVKLESIEFNKKFKTYCAKQLSAFYVLTPPLMLALLKLEKLNPGSITIVFTENKLYVGIYNGKDTFEMKLTKKVDEKMVETFMQDLTIFEDVVNELKLNRKIFK